MAKTSKVASGPRTRSASVRLSARQLASQAQKHDGKGTETSKKPSKGSKGSLYASPCRSRESPATTASDVSYDKACLASTPEAVTPTDNPHSCSPHEAQADDTEHTIVSSALVVQSATAILDSTLVHTLPHVAQQPENIIVNFEADEKMEIMPPNIEFGPENVFSSDTLRELADSCYDAEAERLLACGRNFGNPMDVSIEYEDNVLENDDQTEWNTISRKEKRARKHSPDRLLSSVASSYNDTPNQTNSTGHSTSHAKSYQGIRSKTLILHPVFPLQDNMTAIKNIIESKTRVKKYSIEDGENGDLIISFRNPGACEHVTKQFTYESNFEIVPRSGPNQDGLFLIIRGNRLFDEKTTPMIDFLKQTLDGIPIIDIVSVKFPAHSYKIVFSNNKSVVAAEKILSSFVSLEMISSSTKNSDSKTLLLKILLEDESPKQIFARIKDIIDSHTQIIQYNTRIGQRGDYILHFISNTAKSVAEEAFRQHGSHFCRVIEYIQRKEATASWLSRKTAWEVIIDHVSPSKTPEDFINCLNSGVISAFRRGRSMILTLSSRELASSVCREGLFCEDTFYICKPFSFSPKEFRIPKSTCRHCLEEGHESQDCSNAPKCRCGSLDHSTRNCPLLKEAHGRKRASYAEALLGKPQPSNPTSSPVVKKSTQPSFDNHFKASVVVATAVQPAHQIRLETRLAALEEKLGRLSDAFEALISTSPHVSTSLSVHPSTDTRISMLEGALQKLTIILETVLAGQPSRPDSSNHSRFEPIRSQIILQICYRFSSIQDGCRQTSAAIFRNRKERLSCNS